MTQNEMTQTEQQKNAKSFSENWKDKGDEKQETSKYWIGLLGDVLGIASPQNYIEFEKKVKRIKSHTDSELLRNSNEKNENNNDRARINFIDAYIPETKVLIEQKGIKIDLNKAYEQSDGTVLTPYEQAKRYADEMPYDLRPRWIVVSNFAEIHIHDMNKPDEKPEIIYLKDLEKDYYRLEFLIDRKNENIRREEEISLAAGKLVGKLYDALIKEYINPTAESYRSLNVLCVRLVFCFYAEDAGLFETRTSFEDYIKSFAIENVRKGLIDLFKALDTKLENRDKYDLKLKPFPYVNGGLFHDENIEIPNFTQEIVDVLVNDCAPFNWSEISPTIFGAVFESTLNPETRRKGGMHYTSVQNIHKVIDPLFLDGLNAEFNEIMNLSAKQRSASLIAFQEKLGSLTFLDPACGSGNFLTETYLSLRRLENKVISALNKGEKVLGFDDLFIKVKISQFYGIEINDFAVTVAKTALWIAESQMINETEKIISQQIDFLPLKTQANIVEGNALKMDWSTLTNLDGSKNEQPMLFDFGNEQKNAVVEALETTKEGDFDRLNHHDVAQSPHHYDYIMGNPPFIGARIMEQGGEQKTDIEKIFGDIKDVQDLDYVCGWYKKAALLIQNTKTECAFVSTNSICQGSQVPILWNVLLNELHIKINFAYQTFKWANETADKKDMAAVHCVIVGFACFDRNPKFLFTSDGKKTAAKNISPYLTDSPSIYVEAHKDVLCAGIPKMNMGNMARDGQHFFLSPEEKDEILKKYPELAKWIHPLVGAEEFIKGKKRFCFWLNGITPAEVKNNKVLYERVEAVRKFRLASNAITTRAYAKNPFIWAQICQPETNFIVIPVVSSERRRYIPIGFLTPDNIPTTQVQIIPNATLFHFGVLTSSVHMAWMRVVAGRLKSDYRYSKEIVYNNFPWCSPKDEQKAKIEKTAQGILDARTKYPESSLAELYDEVTMPPDLRKAHEANDRAVMQAYGFDAKMTEAEIVAELFKLYEKLCASFTK